MKMKRNFEQLHLGDWEHGLAKPIAVLSLEPGIITERTGLIFEATRDDLDYLRATLFRTSTGNQFGLTRHQHSPEAGTELVANEKTTDLAAALEEALAALGIDHADVTWIHPEIR